LYNHVNYSNTRKGIFRSNEMGIASTSHCNYGCLIENSGP
jgi:hypothetical protein